MLHVDCHRDNSPSETKSGIRNVILYVTVQPYITHFLVILFDYYNVISFTEFYKTKIDSVKRHRLNNSHTFQLFINICVHAYVNECVLDDTNRT